MLEPNIFKQKIETFSGSEKSKQLSPQLQLIIDNYNTYYQSYLTAADGSTVKAYYTLRLNELEKWVQDQAGYDGLITAIEKVRSKNLIFGTENDVPGLKNILNYLGILCEDNKIQAQETFYAMHALVDLIVINDREDSEKLLTEFKRFFVDDSTLQPINDLAIPRNLTDPKAYALKAYSVLAGIAHGNLDYICSVFSKSWGEDYFTQKESPKQNSRRSTSISITSSLFPEWLRSLVSSRRKSSRESSISTTISSSTSASSLGSSSSSNTLSAFN